MLRSLTITVLLLTGLIAQAQDAATSRNAHDFADRLWFGGGIGLSFGTVTAIQLDPLVGYKVDEEGKFSVGLGGSYWYYQDNRYSPSVNFTGYGYRTFTRYRFIEQLYAHAEFLHLNVERYIGLTDQVSRIWVPHLLVGGGYRQPLGDNSSIYFQALFDVLQDPNSVYRNQGPIISAGVGIGF